MAPTAPQQLLQRGPVVCVRAFAGPKGPSSSHTSTQRLLQRPARKHSEEQQDTLPISSAAAVPPELQQLVQQRCQQQLQQQEQSQQQQAVLLPHPFCELDPPVLTKAIKRCHSWHDAAVLFAQQAPCLNHINLAGDEIPYRVSREAGS